MTYSTLIVIDFSTLNTIQGRFWVDALWAKAAELSV